MAEHDSKYSEKHISLEGVDVVAFMANGCQPLHTEDGSAECCTSCTGTTEVSDDDCVSCTSCTSDTEAA